MRAITVATDGSALSNPNGAAGWAWYVDEDRWDYGGIEKGSNQVAEAIAIYRALRSLPAEVPLIIQTDSQFWINVLGEDGRSGWRAGWKRRGWVKPDGKPPANLKILQTIDALIMKRRVPIKFQWVKGHSDHVLNNLADSLCTFASFQIREGNSVRGPGWRAKSQSLLYPYELPASARKILDSPATEDGRLIKKPRNTVRKASKKEIEERKSQAAAKRESKSPLASSSQKAPQKPSSAPKSPVSAPPRTSSTSTAKGSSSGRSVLSPGTSRRKSSSTTTAQKGKDYKKSVLNPPTAGQRAKMDAELKRKAAAKKKLAQDPSVISFFSEEDGDDIPVVSVGKKEKPKGTYCSSCERPVNLMTGECGKCSF